MAKSDDTMGQNLLPKERKRDWLGALLNSSFGCCEEHKDIGFNEKNVFCIDCVAQLCRHCKKSHSLHRSLQIYKYSYQNVVRHSELQKYFDCSHIQTYMSNNKKIVHLRSRGSSKELKIKRKFDTFESNAKKAKLVSPLKSDGTCENCGNHLQHQCNRFCSVTCKISVFPHLAQRILEDGVNQIDSQNLESESSSTISVAEPCKYFQVVSLRKRPRKVMPKKICYYVFPY